MQENVQTSPPRGSVRRAIQKCAQGKNGAVYVLAFFLPFFIFSLTLALRGVYPFGDRQILNYDGWHQYYPFLMKLWDHVHQGQSLLYDRSMGMGTNFLSLLSYYGASPLNLVLLLSPTRDFRVAFTVLTAAKIGLAGLFTAKLLTTLFPQKKGWMPAFFGTGYALSGFVMGYYWNTMWLDNVALLPLLLWGLVVLLRRGRCAPYILLLGLTLFTNYYIGYMCCLFLILAFAALCFIDRVGWSGFWRRLGRFSLSSLTGGALAAVMLLPAYHGLLNTAAAPAEEMPGGLTFYYSLRDLLAPLADFQIPTVMEEGLPNIYAFALIALFAFAFLWAKRVGFREKLCGVLIAFFLLASLNVTALNYVWHGFHFPNMIPFRFAFLFCLVMVVLGYGYYRRGLFFLDGADAVGMFLFILLLIYCAWGYSDEKAVLATLGLLVTVLVLSALHAARFVPRRVLSGAVCAVLVTEGVASAWLGTGAVGTMPYSTYFSRGEEIAAALEQIREAEGDSRDFYRIEGSSWYSLNDSCLYDYNGVSQFASSANARPAAFFEETGLPGEPASNRFIYAHTTPLINTLLGVKYIYHRGNNLLTDEALTCLAPPGFSKPLSLYEYNGFVGLGFGMDRGAADFAFSPDREPWEEQNALFRAATGLEGDLLIPLEVTAEKSDTLTVTAASSGKWQCTKAGDEEADVLRTTVKTDRYGDVFVYAFSKRAASLSVNNNAYPLADDFSNFVAVGSFRAGVTFSLRVVLRGLADGDCENVTLRAFALDRSLWEAGLERLREEKMEIASFTETKMEAAVTMQEDGYLFTSLPAEREGWTLLVDGKAAEIVPFAGTFVGTPLSAGTHTLSFRYTPGGFVPGLILSLIALALTVALAVAEKKGFRFLREAEKKPVELPLVLDEEDRWDV